MSINSCIIDFLSLKLRIISIALPVHWTHGRGGLPMKDRNRTPGSGCPGHRSGKLVTSWTRIKCKVTILSSSLLMLRLFYFLLFWSSYNFSKWVLMSVLRINLVIVCLALLWLSVKSRKFSAGFSLRIFHKVEICIFYKIDWLLYKRARSVFLLTSNILLVPSIYKIKVYND